MVLTKVSQTGNVIAWCMEREKGNFPFLFLTSWLQLQLSTTNPIKESRKTLSRGCVFHWYYEQIFIQKNTNRKRRVKFTNSRGKEWNKLIDILKTINQGDDLVFVEPDWESRLSFLIGPCNIVFALKTLIMEWRSWNLDLAKALVGMLAS